MVSIFVLISEHPASVSGHNIFTMTNNIADPSSYLLWVYEIFKALHFHFSSVGSELLIHGLRILDPRQF